MNYRQMMYLDAVVRYGSINHAAKALEVSQPNLSRAINKLEEEIGHHLLKPGCERGPANPGRKALL